MKKSKKKPTPPSNTQVDLDAVEDETEVFVPEFDEWQCSIKGLRDFAHRIDDLDDEDRVADPSERLSGAYAARGLAKDAAAKVIAEETQVRRDVDAEIRALEARLGEDIAAEDDALAECRRKTNAVMCLEMEEPCRWNETYKRLKTYIKKNGHLPPAPSACAREADRKLSIWIRENVSLHYSKSKRLTAAPHRVEALEALGVEWIETGEDRWNHMYLRLLAYKREHRTVKLPSFMQCVKSKDAQLGALRRWVEQQAQEVRSGAMARRRDRLQKLQAAGLPVKLAWEHEWAHFTVALLKFRANHGHLNVFGNCEADLAAFVTEVLRRLRQDSPVAVALAKDQRDELQGNGLLRDLEGMSRRPLEELLQDGGMRAESTALVPLNRVKEVNYWVGMLQRLKAYKAEHGSLVFPPLKGAGDGGGGEHADLGEWVEVQRTDYARRMLEECRIKELRKLGLEFDTWDESFHKLRQFKREAGTVRLPKEWRPSEPAQGTTATAADDDRGGEGVDDGELERLCKWVQEQIRLYRKGELDAEKKKKLRKLGVFLTKGHMGKMPWEDRFEEMMDYYHAHKTCLPKRDGPLRQWVVELVDLIQNGYVSQKRQQLIDKVRIGPYLRPEVVFKNATRTAGKKRKAPASEEVAAGGKRSKPEAAVAAPVFV